MLLQVYDKNRTADEFMGSSTISLKDLELYKWGYIIWSNHKVIHK